MTDWTTCPVCGVKAVVTEGRYISIVDGSVWDGVAKLGEGVWAFFTVESDSFRFPCGGYQVTLADGPSHLVGP